MEFKKLTEVYEAIENNKKEEIVQVKEVLERYIANDRNKFLDLKAQIMETEKANAEFQNGLGLVFSILALLVSILATILAVDMTRTIFRSISIVFLLIFFFLLLYLICTSITHKRDLKHRKMRTYITVILEEMEQNWKVENDK